MESQVNNSPFSGISVHVEQVDGTGATNTIVLIRSLYGLCCHVSP